MPVFPNTRAVLHSFGLDVSGKLACLHAFGEQVSHLSHSIFFCCDSCCFLIWFVYQQWKTHMSWIKGRTPANALMLFLISFSCLSIFSGMFYRFIFTIFYFDQKFPLGWWTYTVSCLDMCGWCDNVCHLHHVYLRKRLGLDDSLPSVRGSLVAIEVC